MHTNADFIFQHLFGKKTEAILPMANQTSLKNYFNIPLQKV